MMLEDTVMDWQQGQGRNMAQQASAVTLTPSVASTFTLVQSDAPATPANPVRPTYSSSVRHSGLHGPSSLQWQKCQLTLLFSRQPDSNRELRKQAPR